MGLLRLPTGKIIFAFAAPECRQEGRAAGGPLRGEFDGLKFFGLDCGAMARAPKPD
jgi:hypothetical protein